MPAINQTCSDDDVVDDKLKLPLIHMASLGYHPQTVFGSHQGRVGKTMQSVSRSFGVGESKKKYCTCKCS